ncbi:MAG: ABC transporter permease [Clostridia bacterium]|nr:ABC transporter permease [Clostridia bacterium]
MKTYLKTLSRMFKKHITQFISIIFIVIVSVGFISGIGTSADKIKYSLTDYYKAQNVSDLILRSTSPTGFSETQVQKIRDLYGENVNTGVQLDVETEIDGEKQTVRLCFLDGYKKDEWTVNKPDLIDGNYPDKDHEVLCEKADNKIKGFAIDTHISLSLAAQLPEIEVKIAGIVQSPLTFANDGEPSDNNDPDMEIPDTIDAVNSLDTLDNILYLSADEIPQPYGVPLLRTNAVFIALPDRGAFSAFGKNYDGYVEAQKLLILSTLELNEDEVKIITLNDNYSFVSLKSYADKVMGIGLVLMVAFIFVTALVAQSTMTRLMEEERSQIACLRTLGYSSFKIVFKYVLFAMIAAGLGGVASYFVGLGLAYLIYWVFNYSFTMPPASSTVALPFYLIVFFVIVAITLLATLISGLKTTREAPANLLRPKPPKMGKKVFLERIPFIWNKLSFKYKSTMRNVLRYFGRFIMTVVSVAVSTALVLAGLALLDVCIFGTINSPSVMAIAVVVIIFAGLLTAAVIYTLTNINVSERNRELATLKVLGYQEREVAGYIYREVYIDTVVGIIFGYPLSTLIMWLVFSVMSVGTIGGVSWFWWLIAPAIVMLFAFIVTLMLKRKIVKIDMNESLKAIE